MSGIHTETVRSVHDYTRSKSPWILAACGSKLIRYISGGRLNSFGRLVGQEEARRRHNRFTIWMVAAGIVWSWLYFF